MTAASFSFDIREAPFRSVNVNIQKTVSSLYIWSKTFSYFSYTENEAKIAEFLRPVPDQL